MTQWKPIELAMKPREPEGDIETFLIVGRYPDDGERTRIIESWWDQTEGRWMGWKYPFEPSFFMTPPDVP